MKSKKRETKKAKSVPVKGSTVKDRDESISQSEPSDERGMDFGGLPARDLKKNLGGCG